ncbi:MAG: molybdopterin-dependent oxidoreductase [Eggerthellaceae bacterium]|nr:molybdopterin-dependent oxidoreductase [Eggerthellaceae bacterium]
MLKTATGQGITRRSFLKTTAVTAAGVAALGGLAGCSSGEETPVEETPTPVEETKIFQSCMGNCSGFGCPCYVTVREGKVANIERAKLKCPDGTDSPYQETCLKGYTNIERMYSHTRVLYPMKRAGERGAGQWEQISWDQAVQEITDKWKQLQADYGPGAVAFMPGSGSILATTSYVNRLKTLMGALSIGLGYDVTGMSCQWNHAGFHPLIMGQNEWRDMVNASNLFIWGTNPTESHIVDYHLVSQAKENGAKIVCIDPIYTTSAAKADPYVPIRPATDGLLAAGMAQIAIRDGFMDKAHIQTLTVGPFLVKDSDGLYLRLSDLGQAEAGSAEDRIMVMDGGQVVAFDTATDPEIEGSFEVEGIAVKPACQILLDRINVWDLETIAEITDIPLATIEELAAIYTSGPSIIYTGFGPDHYSNGQTSYDGMLALADITGQEAKHGAGICCTDYSAPIAQGLVSTSTTDLADIAPAGQSISPAHLHELIEKGELVGIKAPKSVYIYIGNPITNYPDRQKMLKSLGSMEMVVVADMFMSETCLYADYVLPAAFLFERSDLHESFSTFVKHIQKAVEPAGEALSDFEIVKKLGIAMGFEEYFTQNVDEFLASCVTNDTAAAAGITWERLQEENAIWSYPEEPVVLGLNTPIYTTSGRFEFYHEGIKPMHDVGQEWDMKKESCWFWEPPIEAWPETVGGFEAVPEAEKYPLLFISERCKFKTHTMFNNSPMILELDPEPYVKVNPKDAEAYGVGEGDIVRVWNDRGYVVIKVALNAGVRPGMLVIDHGWERDGYIEGHYSDLATSESWPRFEQSNWFDCLVEMEKVQ